MMPFPQRAIAFAFGIAVISGVFLLAVWPVLQGRIELGGDEGIESAKAILLLKHPTLISQAWNDQPWTHSLVVATLSKASGISPVLLMRLMALTCVVAFCLQVLMQPALFSSRTARGTAVALTLSWPGIQHLFLAGMLEVPATFLAWSGILLASRGAGANRGKALVGGGLLLGLATSIKLTALIWLPAALLAILLPARSASNPADARTCFGGALKFLAGVLCGVALLLASTVHSGNGLLGLIGAHAAGLSSDEVMDESSFSLGLIFEAPVHFIVAALLPLFSVRPLGPLFWTTYAALAAAVVAHCLHKPFWWYYAMHFAIPTALMGGLLIESLQRNLLPSRTTSERQKSIVILHPLAIILAALWIGFYLKSLNKEIRMIAGAARVQDSGIIRLIERHSEGLDWGYSRNPIYLAYSQVPVPPELAVLAKKRFWAGLISEDGVLKAVQAYEPSVVVITKGLETESADWLRYLSERYTLTAQDPLVMLYFRKDLGLPEMTDTKAMLEKLGM